MPFIHVNGAKLYYETYGKPRPDRAPIVLIHGSYITGRVDWGEVAPLLAREYYVIAPDCRGHGQSENPHHSYSFFEMAADVAGLIRALGYERAHVIGHSNGGNIALVTLLEHPDVVQTCIPQAANAYVSPDLVERIPIKLDPDRVAREDPDWMNEMIALHTPTHGEGYWRELLRMTAHAIITEPNYTPEDLAQVKRPVLVIQGEGDATNAPANHAQFIARHIPDAELWLPAGIGHNVHTEIPCRWVEHVLDFLARRGDDANDALYRLKRARYSDERETVFDVKLQTPGFLEKPGVFYLVGRVLTAEQHQAALDALPLKPAQDEVRVLLTDDTPWALVNRSVADVRREADGLAEQVTQALVGEAVRVLETDSSGWEFVRLERDGYLGWVRGSALHHCSRDDVLAFQSACNVLVIAELAQAYLSPHPSPTRRGEGGEVGKLPFGVALPLVDRRDEWAAVRLPDERVWWVAQTDLLPIAERPQPDAAGIEFTLRLIRRFIGVPYLWGGKSPFGYDCSGLAQTFWGFMGVNIPRDADQQFRVGRPVEGAPQPGDLLFFGKPDDNVGATRHLHITHVAISLGGDEIIHANGGTWNTAYNSLDPTNPIYRADLRASLVGVRRFV